MWNVFILIVCEEILHHQAKRRLQRDTDKDESGKMQTIGVAAKKRKKIIIKRKKEWLRDTPTEKTPMDQCLLNVLYEKSKYHAHAL